MEERSQEQHTIVILGMHRSGTSALTRVMNYLGVDLGPSLLSESEDNETGFWEHTEIVQLNEWLLQISGSCWEDVCLLPAEWWRSEAIVPIMQAMIEIIKKDFSTSPLWGIKDPRMCRMLPLWHSIFAETLSTPIYLIMVRDPREIASSLAKRNNFSVAKSYFLWLIYMLEAERWTRGYKRVFISYQHLLNDWRQVINKVQVISQIELADRNLEIEQKIDDFLDPGLRHHITTGSIDQSDLGVESKLASMVCELHRVLISMCEDRKGDAGETFSEVFDEISAKKRTLSMGNSAGLGRSLNQQQLENSAKTVAAFFNSLERDISLIIPTRSGDYGAIACIESMVETLKGPDQSVVIIQDTARNQNTLKDLKELSYRQNIDVFDYNPPFDISVLDHPSVKQIRIIMYNFHFAYLAQLARYGKTKLLHTDCGPSIVITFRNT